MYVCVYVYIYIYMHIKCLRAGDKKRVEANQTTAPAEAKHRTSY